MSSPCAKPFAANFCVAAYGHILSVKAEGREGSKASHIRSLKAAGRFK